MAKRQNGGHLAHQGLMAPGGAYRKVSGPLSIFVGVDVVIT